jgi:hypothetical protein
MAIDRIGKGGAPPAAGGAGGPTGPNRPAEAGKTFSVDAAEGATAARPADAVAAPSPLAELRAGRLSLDGYLDAKVNEATAHLEGMPPAKLAELKNLLRDKLASDPTLTELVAQATGQVPTPPEDS